MSELKQARRTKRRGNSEGSIYQRPDGRWIASVSLGYSANGQRRRRVIYGKSKTEVQEKLTALQGAKVAGTLTDPSRETVATFLGRWLQDVARVSLKPTTFDGYSCVVKNHVLPHIGGVRLQKLSPSNVQALYSLLERGGVGPAQRRKTHTVLRLALQVALKQGLLARNVADAVEAPKVADSEPDFLTPEQVNRLLAAAEGDRLQALYVLEIGTGLRLGELFGLGWEQVDLAAGVVTVTRSLTEVSGKLALSTPKTRAGRRRLDISPEVVEALERHRKEMFKAGFGGSEYVFLNKSGGPLRRSHFHKDEFKPLLRRAGLPPIKFHSLRHTHASLLLAAGVHAKIVSERLGHSQIGITMDLYSHAMPSMGKDASRTLWPLLEKANGNTLATLVG